MPQMVDLGNYILDTLQIYFPWDDDLYTELKAHGFGRGESKVLPLVYSDNTESTIGQSQKSRKNVIRPELYGNTYESLGWTRTDRKTQPIIPAEKSVVNFSMTNMDKEPLVKITIIPTIQGKEQYHIEYSPMTFRSNMFSNWAMLYFVLRDFTEQLEKIKNTLHYEKRTFRNIKVYTEDQQNQREEMIYAELPLIHYQFCLMSFRYIVEFFEHNGIRKGDTLPSLIYDCNDEALRQIISPYLKLGIVHTKEGTGFELRKPQVVLKIAQDIISVSKRNKRAKLKGKIVHIEDKESYILVKAKEFIDSSEAIIAKFQNRSSQVRFL